jgi:hypothetical protein
MMHVIVSMDEAGSLVLTNAQGDRLAECFFRTEDETPRELQLLGYTPLLQAYPVTYITVGHGLEQDDLGDVFLEG